MVWKVAIGIICFLQKTKSCTTLQRVHLIKELMHTTYFANTTDVSRLLYVKQERLNLLGTINANSYFNSPPY